MYNNATIVTLEPTTDGSDAIQSVRSATFEEAFGEFSEARGKGRAKRQAKKLERQKNKAERKVARQTTKQAKIKAKQETKQVRKGGRQEARIARRATRKSARQDMRSAQQSARMDRRDNRLAMRQNRTDAKQTRKDTRAQAEEERENLGVESQNYRDNLQAENETYRDNMQAENEAYRDTLQPQDTGSEESYDENYADESVPQDGGEYYEDEYAYEDSMPQGSDEYYEDESYGNEEYPEEAYYSNEDEGYYEEDDYYSADGEETEFFDGVELDSNFHEVEGVKVNPKLQEIMDKIEWNKELLAVLEKKRKTSRLTKDANADLAKKIINTQKRIATLEARVKGYSSFDDAYSSADGIFPKPEVIEKVKARRGKEVAIAGQRAVQKKIMAKKQRTTSRNLKDLKSRKDGGDSTPVDVELNPEISEKRIVIPASSSADGEYTTTSVVDDLDGYDTNQVDVFLGTDFKNEAGTPPFEFYSNADGDSKKGSGISVAGVVVGLALGALAIWGVRKYKLLN